jgi:hypothetical protein
MERIKLVVSVEEETAVEVKNRSRANVADRSA